MFLKFVSWYIAHLFLLVCSFQMYFHSLFDHSIVNLLFSCSVVSNSLWPHRLQHTRLCYASPSLKTCSNSCPLSEWYHPNISSSVIPFSSCLQSFPTSGSFPVSWFFAPCGQSIGASASASVLPMDIRGWFPLGLTGLILQFKGISRVFSSITVWSINSSALSLLEGPILSSIHDYWKNHSFDYMDLCQ